MGAGTSHPVENRRVSRGEAAVLWLYALWTVFVVTVVLMRAGLSPDNVTRLGVIGYLLASLAWYRQTMHRPPQVSGPVFVATCCASALTIEFFYMVSRPVFHALLVTADTPARAIVANTLIDFAFTLPVYVAVFSAMWWLIRRYTYGVAEFALLFPCAQALGDGNAFFAANPAMLLFAPYVVLNYQAITVVPYLRARDALPPGRRSRVLRFVLPLVVVFALYWIGGALIIVAGRRFGLH